MVPCAFAVVPFAKFLYKFTLGRVKKKNMSHVRVFQKKEEEVLFIIFFLFQDGRHSLLKCQIPIVFSTAEIHKT